MNAESTNRADRIRGVLFDLDGTLLDTAPDLVYAVNAALADGGFKPGLPEQLRPLISGGMGAMIRQALDAPPESIANVLEHALTIYQENLAVNTRLFDGMETVLARLDDADLQWGIVTNKHTRFTEPLLQSLGLTERAGCAISGDTTPERKPHPLPMFEACKVLGLPPRQCVYIGDDARDILAGRRAGTATLAAAYGYAPDDDDPNAWGADGLIHHPEEVLHWLGGRAAA
jgi:phosphoglycolate phosphatase